MFKVDKTKSKKGIKSKSRIVLNEEILIKQRLNVDISKKYYQSSRKKYNDFFMKCLEEIEDLQPSGFACIQISRSFTVGVLPKYCSIPDPLTRKQRARVEKLLAE